MVEMTTKITRGSSLLNLFVYKSKTAGWVANRVDLELTPSSAAFDLDLQKNFIDSNTDGSFTVADSNSVLSS